MEKARILIVEDEAIIAMEIESQLQSLGYEVTSVVDTGEKAIAKAEKDKPDLMLMDIRIKGEMDGIEAAQVIRNSFGIPVIFSTAYLDEKRIERAKITMPFGYVLKPIQERDLKVTIEMALYVAKVDVERRKAEDRYKGLVNIMNSGVAVYQVINDGRSGSDYIIKSFNNFALKHEGYSLDEIVGKSLKDVRPTIDEYGLVDTFRKVWQTGVSEFFEAKIYVDDKYSNYYENRVFRLPSGEIVAIYDDVTEQKQAEQKIIESENLLREVINSMEKAIVIYESVNNGEDFRFVDTNEFAEKIMHYKIEDVIGKTIKDLFPAESSIDLVNKLKETFLTGKSTTIPLKQYQDDRITQWVENYIFKLPSGKVVAMFEDTTEKQKKTGHHIL
jgi:PAS domain S-box-containing protein